MKTAITISDKVDREALALILVKAGYKVQITKTKLPGANKFVYQVEYEGKGETSC